MANPQLEDGHTQIANEILDVLMRTYIPPNQWQVLVCIIRKTYGFKKKVDWIANSQIAENTGLARSTVSRALKLLEKQHLIIRNGRTIGFNKDWEQWEISRVANSVDSPANSAEANHDEKVDSTANSPKVDSPANTVDSAANKKLTALLPTKEIIKETIQKKEYGEFNNVFLTEEEFQKLQTQFGGEAQTLIERLSSYMASKGKRYKSHYATILNWSRRDKEGKGATIRNPRELPKTYANSPNYPDLA